MKRGRPLNSQSATPPEIEKRVQELRRRAEVGEPLWPMPPIEAANEAMDELDDEWETWE